MERDFGTELDQLKAEVQELRRMLSTRMLPKTEPKIPAGFDGLLTTESSERLNELRDQLLDYTAQHNTSGAVAYTGTFCTGEGEGARQSVWASMVPADFLLRLNENHMVERVLSSVGNRQRLAILLALLKHPMTASQLMEVLGSNTTGQVYHHLKPLVSADLIQEEKGIYTVIPHRVQGILMLLTGVWDLIDTRYSNGAWDAQEA